jgi:hypothetical protein
MATCACLTMNGVGEPCAGEPHARFDRGPLARTADTNTMGDEAKALRPTHQTATNPAAYLTAQNLEAIVIMGPTGPQCSAGSAGGAGIPSADIGRPCNGTLWRGSAVVLLHDMGH